MKTYPNGREIKKGDLVIVRRPGQPSSAGIVRDPESNSVLAHLLGTEAGVRMETPRPECLLHIEDAVAAFNHPYLVEERAEEVKLQADAKAAMVVREVVAAEKKRLESQKAAQEAAQGKAAKSAA